MTSPTQKYFTDGHRLGRAELLNLLVRAPSDPLVLHVEASISAPNPTLLSEHSLLFELGKLRVAPIDVLQTSTQARHAVAPTCSPNQRIALATMSHRLDMPP